MRIYTSFHDISYLLNLTISVLINFLAGIKATQLQKRALIEVSHDSLMLIEAILENPLQIGEIIKSSHKFTVTIAHVIVLAAVYGSNMKQIASIISQVNLSETSLSMATIKSRKTNIFLSLKRQFQQRSLGWFSEESVSQLLKSHFLVKPIPKLILNKHDVIEKVRIIIIIVVVFPIANLL
jgi:hypothetical protein